MGLWQRARDVLASRRAGADAGRLQDRLDETYRRHLATIQQVRRGVADVSTSRKRVEVRLVQVRQQAEALDAQAREAVARGDDDAARAALTRKVSLEQATGDLEQQHATLRAEEERLQASATDLERRLEDFRIRKDTLAARHTAATARRELDDAATGITSSLSGVNQQMAEAERHTRELEARADAMDELAAEGLVPRPGESTDAAERRRFDALLAGDAGDGLDEAGTMEGTKGDDDGPHPVPS